ncbi:MAG TPA: hypothetical protein DEH25_06485 [Chloroflexi bacterium]|nr:hypothetical protein [Chloroflexota bacterium]
MNGVTLFYSNQNDPNDRSKSLRLSVIKFCHRPNLYGDIVRAQQMNTSLGKPIALGRTAEIYAWGNGQILKLFFDWFPFEDIQYELRIAKAIEASGLPVPAAGEIIQINGRTGLTYQRVEGVAMLAVMAKKPWLLPRFARRMAELHAEMHANTAKLGIPNLRQKLTHKINRAEALTPSLRAKTLAKLENMPEGDRLCHGDFHPANILVAEKEEIIIDWIDASVGNPLADLARTSIIILGAVNENQLNNPLLNIALRSFHAKYLRRYFALRPGGEADYQRWLPIVAAARLSENIPELEKWLIAQAEKEI